MAPHANFTEEFPLGRRFGLLMRMYFGALTKKLEELDIDRHYSILIILENKEAACSQQDVANLLRIDKASMVRIIDYLVKKKYIKRMMNPSDRREHILCLTEKARKTLPRIHRAVGELNSAAFSGLSKSNQKGFYQSLDLLARNLGEEPANTIVVDFKKVKTGRK
ncbi:MAG: MarR family winged helix-turn-helix transcriptional regulator [Bacteroidia bacterium]